MTVTVKDEIILKDASDIGIKATLTAINPGLTVAYELAASFFGSGIKLRQAKALEWVEFIKHNRELLAGTITETEAFQDAFVYVFEAYIKERNETKRIIMKAIFKGYVLAGCSDNFPLERNIHTLGQLDTNNMVAMRDAYTFFSTEYDEKKGINVYESPSQQQYEALNHLISLGLLRNDGLTRYDGGPNPFVLPTDFGSMFIDYLIDENGSTS